MVEWREATRNGPKGRELESPSYILHSWVIRIHPAISSSGNDVATLDLEGCLDPGLEPSVNK